MSLSNEVGLWGDEVGERRLVAKEGKIRVAGGDLGRAIRSYIDVANVLVGVLLEG